MSKPDITKAQLIALFVACINLLQVFGVPLTEAQVLALREVLDATLVIVGADAVVRVARNFGKN